MRAWQAWSHHWTEPAVARILIVDDSPDIRLVMRRLLEVRGHAVEVAGSGAEALRKVAEGPFDLMLLDISMPEMDGLSVLRALHDASGTPRLPVIMLSALSGEQHLAEASELGACDYLVKPQIDLEELEKRMASCLARPRRGGPGDAEARLEPAGEVLQKQDSNSNSRAGLF